MINHLSRTAFDLASGYTIGKTMNSLDERSVLTRCIFLETIAGKQNNSFTDK